MTSYPHRIRLRGPWEYESPPLRGRVNLTAARADLGLAAPAPVRFRRHFGYPGHVDVTERVFLVVAGASVPLAVALNGEALGEMAGVGEWDVTERLLPRNELQISATTADVPWAEAFLEVRKTAHLRGLRVWAEGRNVCVTGHVVGRSEGPLELYVVADRRPVAYLTLNASDAGTPFDVSAECEAGPPRLVKVELVRGASAWYTAEVELVGE